MDNNQLNGSQYLEVKINNLKDEKGDTHTLKDSLFIGIAKTASRYNYPLVYEQDFNYKPTESYVESNMFTCSDNLYDESPD